MPWEKKFDDDDVLDKAMHAFWSHVYEATSIHDLIACMGINRGSIYATFGDKKNLFLKAFEHYEQNYRRAVLGRLQKSHSPRTSIAALFDMVVDTAETDDRRAGCMLINTAVELSAHDAKVAEAVANGLAEMQTFFRQQIEAGKQAGEIAADVDTEQVSAALLGLLTGLRVLARSRPERAVMEPLARQAVALLNEWLRSDT